MSHDIKKNLWQNCHIISLVIMFFLAPFYTGGERLNYRPSVSIGWKSGYKVPLDKKASHISKLYAHKAIFEKYGIDPVFGIAQAIVEQGWSIRNDYRIYNVTWTKGCGKRYVQLDLKYRVYDSLEEAIEDYCKTLQSKRYAQLLNRCWQDQCTVIGGTGYAEDKDYSKKIFPIARSVDVIIKSLQ